MSVFTFSMRLSFALFTVLPLMASPQVAIVGGGLAGLTAAYRLEKEYGITAQVYEASGRLGGKVFTKTCPGMRVELGASFIDQDHEAIRSLAVELGLGLTLLKDQGHEARLYFINGQLLNYNDMYTFFSPTARLIKNDMDLIALERKLDPSAILTPKENELNQLTIKEYLNSLNAPELFLTLANATQASENGAFIDRLNALMLLDLIQIDLDNGIFWMDGQQGDEGSKILGGNSALIDKLATSLENAPILHHQLVEISRNNSGDSYELTFMVDKHLETIIANYIILALPTPIIKNNIKMDQDKLLPSHIRTAINEFENGNVSKFIMVFSDPVWKNDPNHMVEIMTENYDIWDSSFREHGNNYHHLTIYAGGKNALNNMDIDPAFYSQQILQSLELLYPHISSVFIGTVPSIHWPSYPFSQAGYGGVFLPGQWQYRRIFDNPVAGNLIFAGDQWSLEHLGFMNGAVESGERAAYFMALRIKGQHCLRQITDGIDYPSLNLSPSENVVIPQYIRNTESEIFGIRPFLALDGLTDQNALVSLLTRRNRTISDGMIELAHELKSCVVSR